MKSFFCCAILTFAAVSANEAVITPGYQQSSSLNPDVTPGYEQSSSFNPDVTTGYEQSSSLNPAVTPGYEQSSSLNPEVKPGYEQSDPSLIPFAATRPPGSLCPRRTYHFSVPAYGKTIHIHHEELTWCDAQKFCRAKYGNGGRLWEPSNDGEYDAVRIQAISLNSDFRTPCKWWIGVLNWSNNNGENGVFASLTNYLRRCPREPTIRGAPFTWKQINDFAHDGNAQNCVDIGYRWFWGDESCQRKMKFICAEKKPKPNDCACKMTCKQVSQRGNYAYCPAGWVPTSCSCGNRCGSWNLLINGCYCHIGCMAKNRPLDWTAATCCKLT